MLAILAAIPLLRPTLAGRALLTADDPKLCLADFVSGMEDKCSLYALYTDCTTRLEAFETLAGSRLVHVRDPDGNVQSVILRDPYAFADLEALFPDAAGLQFSFEYMYATSSITTAITNDADLERVLKVLEDTEAIITAEFTESPTPGPTSTPTMEFSHPWVNRGDMVNFDTIINNFPPAQYDYGVRYNHIGGYVHRVTINGWNRGLRLTTEMYMQGDNSNSLSYGVAMFTRSTSGQDDNSWLHNYYRLQGGSYNQWWSNGNTDTVDLYTREFINPWVRIGELRDFDTHINNYPPTLYRYGITYNTGGIGYIHPVVVSSWNRGTRVTTENYMTGDNASSMELGLTVFTRGLDDGPSDTWIQDYYRMTGGQYNQFASNSGDPGNLNFYAMLL